MRHKGLFLLLITCAAASAWAAQAPALNGGLGKGPVHISADSLHAENQPRQQAVYTGKVVMTQGDVVINAQTLTIDAAQGKIQKATAIGSPVTFTMSAAQRHGYGNILVYLPDSAEIILTGNAHLWQEKNEVSGERIVYFLQDQQTRVTAVPGQRVQSVFYPAAANRSASGNGKKP